jgi:hypothetical protein
VIHYPNETGTQERGHILENEDGRPAQQQMVESGIKQGNRPNEVVVSREPIKIGEDHARISPAGQMTRRSVASTHRLGALEDNRRLRLQARMYSADDGAAGRVNV